MRPLWPLFTCYKRTLEFWTEPWVNNTILRKFPISHKSREISIHITLSKSFTTLASIEEFSSYSIHNSLISWAAANILQQPVNWYKSMVYIKFKENNNGWLNILLPLSPPPSSSHIFCNASCSRRLFSSFGTPSEGVISPTIAIHRNQTWNLAVDQKHAKKRFRSSHNTKQCLLANP